jgi:hypothetical protein
MALILLLATAPPIAAQEPAYRAGFTRWRAAENGFRDWAQDGMRSTPMGTLRLDLAIAHQENDPYAPSSFNGHNFYSGGSYLVGEATSPITPTEFSFTEAVASWNVDTPPGTWSETQIRARLDDGWTTWYNLGVWASDASIIERHSLGPQRDANGSVDVDTLVLNRAAVPADALQVKVRLFSADGVAVPSIRNVAVAYSTPPIRAEAPSPGDPEKWGRTLPVAECSQMVYLDGGEVWCSPTSTAMVLAYWGRKNHRCEFGVRAAVAGVYDWLYDGHGNWPFNTAYAATRHWKSETPGHGGRAWARSPIRRVRGQNLESSIARFTGLSQAEEWIASGVPVIVSLSWGPHTLTGAPFVASSGHLAVLVGFDDAGNPVVNDPGAPNDASVQRIYLRAEFEPLWLGHTGGTVYLIHPPGWPVPDLKLVTDH